MSGSRPPVYVTIVNLNGWTDTIECLESLMRSDYENLQVILCDNASTDGSFERLREWGEGRLQRPPVASDALGALSHPPISKPIPLACYTRAEFEAATELPHNVRLHFVACGANLGFAGANNVGLRHVQRSATAAFAMLLNNDAVVAPNAISAMVSAASEGVGAVGATILQYHDPDRVEMLGGARLSRVHGMTAPVHEGAARDAFRPPGASFDFITGCCILLPRATLDAVGIMDERYFLYGEDADWGLRITDAGLRLTYCAGAEVWHKGGASVEHRSAFHDYYDVRGRLMLIHKHFPWMLPLALIHSAVRCMLPKIIRGEWDRLRAALRGWKDFIAHARGRAMTVPSVR
jgi:GT2 family glycosyltransferase